MAEDSSKEEMARKAQKLAEESFGRGNVFGAKQWMQSSVKLAPGLPGNAHAVAAYDVQVAGRRPPPERWYAVLGLPDPRGGAAVTHDDVKRQHRKLCLQVHPDKNPLPAADGAFKLVQAAWDELSVRHPPLATSTTAAAATAVPTWSRAPPPPAPAPRSPDPPPTPRPRVVQMQRRAAAAPTRSYAQAPPPPRAPNKTSDEYSQRAPQKQRARRRMPPPPPAGEPSPPTAGMCPNCGASTSSYGKRNFRCMSCQWSPMDGRQDDDLDDDDYDY